jgi:hypothetical protein
MGLCCFSSNPVNLKNVIDPSKTPVNTIVQTTPVDEFADMPPLTRGDTFPMELEKKVAFDNFIDNFETISCKTKRHNNRLYIKYQYMNKFLDFIVYTANDIRFISVNKVSLELELFNSIYTVMDKDENSTTIIFKTGKDITIDCPSNIVIRALSDNFFNECSDEAEVEAEQEPEPEEEETPDTSEKQVSKMIDVFFEKPNYTFIYFATILLFGLSVASTTVKHPYDI